jgi:hypothetical protein
VPPRDLKTRQQQHKSPTSKSAVWATGKAQQRCYLRFQSTHQGTHGEGAAALHLGRRQWMTLKLVSLSAFAHDARRTSFRQHAAHRVCLVHQSPSVARRFFAPPKRRPHKCSFAGPWIKEQRTHTHTHKRRGGGGTARWRSAFKDYGFVLNDAGSQTYACSLVAHHATTGRQPWGKEAERDAHASTHARTRGGAAVSPVP